MRNETIHAVEMTRKIRDAIYEETKHLSEQELIRYFKEKAASGSTQQRRSEGARRPLEPV